MEEEVKNNNKLISLALFAFCLAYFVSAVFYYLTGYMGAMFWVLALVPLAYIIYVLDKLKHSELYPNFGKLQYVIGMLYIVLCIFFMIYLPMNYMNIIYYRAGSYTFLDKVIGSLLMLLMLEYARKEHKVLFGLMILLIVYCLFGEHFPGLLRSPGISLERIVTSSTVEVKLGMFGTYAQVGVGIIGAFLLLMGVARGFKVERSLIKTIIGTLGKKPTLVPQTAVVSSMAVAMCTGSGAADSALVGQFTIPAMRRVGFPAIYAAATEGSAALGGLVMPPVMAIAAFLMAEFLGVSYFEVIVRGFVLGFIYYISIALTVYLLTLQYVKPGKIKSGRLISQIREVTMLDKLNTATFFFSLILLIYLMGGLWWPEIRAALMTVFVFIIIASTLRLIFRDHSLKEKVRDLVRCLKDSIESYPILVADILLLLAVLGILINLFTVSGWLLKLGMMLMDVGKENVLNLVALGFLFAFFLGFGLPPSAVYILTAVLVAPYFTYFGINPWVAHFFIFLAAAISEFTPPVALIAAVTSRIAETSFVKTAFYTQKWILPMYLLIFTVISWPDLVVKPGAQMLVAFGIVLIGCLTVTLGSFGKLSNNRVVDLLVRCVLIALGLAALYHPEKTISTMLAPILLIPTILGIKQTQKITQHLGEGKIKINTSEV